MKKLTLCVIFLLAITAGTAMAQEDSGAGYSGPDVNLRLGIQYPDAPERVGLDCALGLNYWINPYFAVGADTGFGWITKEYGKGAMVPAGGGIPLMKSDTLNIFSLPVLAKLTIGIPIAEGILPYISGGAGYSWQFYRFPGYNDIYHGFTWEVVAGSSVSLGEAANGMEVMAEVGYRGTNTKNGSDYELDMSGFIAHLGVRFPLAGSSASE